MPRTASSLARPASSRLRRALGRALARALVALTPGLLAGVGAAACRSDAECVIDTDCASFAHVCMQNRCVPPSTPTDGGGMPRDAERGDGATADGGAMDDGGGAAADGGDGLAPLRVAYITAISGPGESHHVRAFFASYADRDDGCMHRTMGGCALSACPVPADAFDAVEAGTITVSSDVGSATLMPGPSGRYDSVTGSGALFGPGDTVTFAASGSTMGGLRMFSDTLTAPSIATLTAPPITAASGSLLLPETGGVDLAWTVARGSALSVHLGVDDAAAGRYRSATCTFDASLGAASVPEAVLAFLGPGNMAVYSVWTETSKESGVGGGWTVTLVARLPVRVSDGGRPPPMMHPTP
jgi:hypothetical protein